MIKKIIKHPTKITLTIKWLKEHWPISRYLYLNHDSILKDGKVSFRPFRIIESEKTLENKYHCKFQRFFSLLPSPPFFYFPRPVARFIWHAIRDRQQRVHLVSMKSKSIFSQITHASLVYVALCDNTREYHFSPLLLPSPTVFSSILSFIHSFISQFVSFEILWRDRVVNSSRGGGGIIDLIRKSKEWQSGCCCCERWLLVECVWVCRF